MTNTAKIPTKSPDFEIDPENLFEKDPLGREELCEGLENFIGNSTTPYVLAINGNWGSGKTVFLRMLEAHLTNQGFRCVYFDAWKADFYDNALPALIGEIKEKINDGFYGKIKKLVTAIVTLGGITKICAILITFFEPFPLGGAIAKTISESGKNNHDHPTKHYLKYRKALKKFRQSLKKVAQNRGKNKPLVILVDELDRCRPNFALDILEKAKHIFNVESVFFIFALNKKELGKTIETVYGQINAEHYLRRFFDETMNLVNPTNLLLPTMDEIGLTDLLQKRIELGINDYGHDLSEYLNLFFTMFELSLRDQQQVLASMSISLRMTSPDEQVFLVLLSYFSVIKLANPDLFRRSRIGTGRNNQSSFPYEEHLKFYRDKANLENPEDTKRDIDSLHRIPYLLLNIIYYKHDAKYKERVAREMNNSPDDFHFWKDIYQASDRHSSAHVPNNLGHYIGKIDSIGKLISESE